MKASNNILKEMLVKYNIILAPLAAMSLLIVYAGLRIENKVLLLTGIILTILSPFVAYMFFRLILQQRKG